MTVCRAGTHAGRRLDVVAERAVAGAEPELTLVAATGDIDAQLSVGARLTTVAPLQANERLCWQGCKLVGEHFQINPELRQRFLSAQPEAASRLPSYWAGSDITRARRPRFVIDMFGLSEAEARSQYPRLMQHLIDYVQPERRHNRDQTFREKWWIFGRPRPDLREANQGLSRYIVTSEVAKHRTFIFLDWPDNVIDGGAIAITSADAFVFGIVSSRIHTAWAIAAGGRMGVGDDPRYQNARCFDPFPFPVCTDGQKSRIRALGESLDAHRKRQQAVHPSLTITDMYNVLEKLRRGEELTAKDRVVHEQGIVSVLKQIHDDLDAAVAEAYGWPVDLADEEILRRLVALNAERAEEEKRWIVRWLRPEFQNPTGAGGGQGTLGIAPVEKAAKAKKAEKLPWPKSLAEQAQAVRAALGSRPKPATSAELSKQFKGAKAERIAELLATLAALG